MASSSLPHYFWPRLQEIELSLNTVVIILETLGKNLRKPKPEKPKKIQTSCRHFYLSENQENYWMNPITNSQSNYSRKAKLT